MSEDVVKKVRVQYTVEDHAAGPLGRIAHEAKETGGAVEKLKDRFRDFRGETALMAAGILGVGFGLTAWVEKAKDANREFGGAQKAIASTMATILDWPRAMAPVDKFTRSMGLANGVTRELDEKAADYGMQLGDLARAYNTIGVAAGPLNLSQKQWLDLSLKSAAAAKQFGIDAADAANQIGGALVKKAIKPAGDLGKFLFNEVGGNLHKLNNAQILAKLDKALGQSQKIAEQMGQGMGGSIARIQNNVDDLFRDVTGPLFKEVSKELDGFSRRLREGGEAGKPLIELVGGKLVTAFREAKELAGFIADHWKTIAIVVGGMKFNSTVGQLGEMARGIKDIVGSVGKVGAGAGGAGGLMGMASAIGPVVAGLAAFKVGLDLLIGFIESKMDESRAGHEKANDVTGALGILGRLPMGPLSEQQRKFAGGAMERLQKAGLVGSGGKADMGRVHDTWGNLEEGERKNLAGAMGFKMNPYMPFGQMNQGPMIQALAERVETLQAAYGSLSHPALNAPENDANLKTAKHKILFTGPNHWELKFEDADPDRIMLRFQDDAENFVNRRTSSVLSDPLGD